MHMAFKSGSRPLLYTLHEHGADFNAVNNDNMTPLCYGTFAMLKELNLLDGFATFNEGNAKEQVGKEHRKMMSIATLQKSSTLLDTQVRKFLEGTGGVKTENAKIGAGKTNLSTIGETVGSSNIRRKSQKGYGRQSRLRGTPKPRSRGKRKTMMIKPSDRAFLSNNLNYRYRRGKTEERPRAKPELQKKRTFDQKKTDKKNKKTLKQFKTSMKEYRLAEGLKKKRKTLKEKNPFEFENDFREDTCGCDVFLLKKLTQMYDPKLPNEIHFKVNNILKVNDHRGKFFKQQKLRTK